jgi:hypothetical protein
MNADIPYLRCWVRLPYISKREGLEEAYAFAIQSYPGRALAFHVMLKSGAHYRGVPIHALVVNQSAPEISLSDAQLWDCFTFHPVVHCYQYLRDHEAICNLRSGPVNGNYLFTVDWLPDHNGPGFVHLPEQNKCGHVLVLETGNLCCLPTNRIAWRDGYFVGARPDPKSQGYAVQEEVYQSEDSAWDVSRSEAYVYSPQDAPVRPISDPVGSPPQPPAFGPPAQSCDAVDTSPLCGPLY